MAITGLFGSSPYELQQGRQAQLAAAADAYGKTNPNDPYGFDRARSGLYMAGNQLGGGIAGLLGAQDPEMKKAADLQAILQQFDMTTPEGLMQAGKVAQAKGYGNEAMQAFAKAQEMTQARALTRKTTADATKVELEAQREENLRKELANLPEGFTNADVEKVVIKYGGADKVLATLTAVQARQAAAEAKVEAAQIKADNDLQMAARRGEDMRTLTQMKIDSDQKIAQMQQETKQMLLSMKPPSAAQLKAETDAAKKAEGKEGLSGTLTVANKLIDDIAAKGGMTDTTVNGLSNVFTALGASPIGQGAARMAGTDVQAKRDELDSVRLQLLNAVKESTGMSSQQLNSNVELQTWLNSLGSSGMSKQANKAILKNIENRFLKGYQAPAGADTDPLGIRK